MATKFPANRTEAIHYNYNYYVCVSNKQLCSQFPISPNNESYTHAKTQNIRRSPNGTPFATRYGNFKALSKNRKNTQILGAIFLCTKQKNTVISSQGKPARR